MELAGGPAPAGFCGGEPWSADSDQPPSPTTIAPDTIIDIKSLRHVDAPRSLSHRIMDPNGCPCPRASLDALSLPGNVPGIFVKLDDYDKSQYEFSRSIARTDRKDAQITTGRTIPRGAAVVESWSSPLEVAAGSWSPGPGRTRS